MKASLTEVEMSLKGVSENPTSCLEAALSSSRAWMTAAYGNDVVGVVLGVLQKRSLVHEVLHDGILDLREVSLQNLAEDGRRVDILIVGHADLLIQIREFQVHMSMMIFQFALESLNMPFYSRVYSSLFAADT